MSLRSRAVTCAYRLTIADRPRMILYTPWVNFAVGCLPSASWVHDAGSLRGPGATSVFVFLSRWALLRQHVAVEVAAVGREHDGLRFEEVERSPKGEIRSVVVCLRVPGLVASLRVSAHYARGSMIWSRSSMGWRPRGAGGRASGRTNRWSMTCG
jgi:hypothetical protein